MESISHNPPDSNFPTAIERGMWAIAIVLLVVNVPIIVCMPLTADTALFDIQAKVALQDGVLYRDAFEPNLPGVVWVHMAVRSIAGWSSEALRFFDLLVVAGMTFLLTSMIPASRRLRGVAAVLVATCYFSMTEWCHCQRDTWMMLPALAALSLRLSQLKTQTSTARILVYTLLEGILWGIAFWLKPFIAIPALFCITNSAFINRDWKRTTVDVLGVVLGGAIIGAIGSYWLMSTGAWPYFWDIFLNWNPEYLAAGKERWTLERLHGMNVRFYPWMFVHLAALPIAMIHLINRKQNQASEKNRALLAALYLGWLVQSFGFQHLLDYIHLPAILLGIAVVFSADWSKMELTIAQRTALAFFLLMVISYSPVFQPERLTLAWSCMTNGSTNNIREHVKSNAHPEWDELEHIANYLKRQNVKTGDVTCFNGNTIHLYAMLGIQPSNRFVYLENMIRLFPSKRNIVREELERLDHRFIVSSLRESGMSDKDACVIDSEQPASIPDRFPSSCKNEFPWTQPVVFRSGHYVVHKVDVPLGEFSTTARPLQRSDAGNHLVISN